MMKYIKITLLVILLMTFQSFALESLLSGSVSGSSQEYVEFDAPPLFLLKADEAATTGKDDALEDLTDAR